MRRLPASFVLAAYVVGALTTLALLALSAAAHGQAPTPSPATAPTGDPLLGILQTLLGSSPTTAVLVAIASLYGLGPRLATRIGIGPDPVVQSTLARHDERSRETRREVRQLRATMHWQGQVLTALALQAGVTIPPPPATGSDADSDEDES